MTWHRPLLALVALAAYPAFFGLSSPADAQQSASPRRIGVFLPGLVPESKMAQAFREGLRDAGYVEGRDVVSAAAFALREVAHCVHANSCSFFVKSSSFV